MLKKCCKFCKQTPKSNQKSIRFDENDYDCLHKYRNELKTLGVKDFQRFLIKNKTRLEQGALDAFPLLFDLLENSIIQSDIDIEGYQANNKQIKILLTKFCALKSICLKAGLSYKEKIFDFYIKTFKNTIDVEKTRTSDIIEFFAQKTGVPIEATEIVNFIKRAA